MGDGLPLKRTSVGTSHFGHTPPVLELIQPVLCPYSGETSPADATLYYHILSLPCLHFLGEISAVHKGERTVDVLFKDGDRDANVPMHLVKRYMYGDSCDQTLQREELADMCGMNVARSSRRKGKTYLSPRIWASRVCRLLPHPTIMCLSPIGSSSPAPGRRREVGACWLGWWRTPSHCCIDLPVERLEFVAKRFPFQKKV